MDYIQCTKCGATIKDNKLHICPVDLGEGVARAGQSVMCDVKPITENVMIQEISIETGSSFYGNPNVISFLMELVKMNFSVDAEKGRGGLVIKASRIIPYISNTKEAV